MILFRPEHVAPILEGRKTQTRRLGDRRWNIGAIHQCRTRMMDAASTFARIRILEVREERLRDISEVDAGEEGYDSRAQFLGVFFWINRRWKLATLNPLVWVVWFEVVRPTSERP